MFPLSKSIEQSTGMLDASWQMQQTSLFEDEYLEQAQQEEAEYNAAAIEANYAEEKATEQFQTGQREKAGELQAMLASQRNLLANPDSRSPHAAIDDFNALQAALDDKVSATNYKQKDIVEGVGSPYMSAAFGAYSEALYRQKLVEAKSPLFGAAEGLTGGDETRKLLEANAEVTKKAREHAIQSVMDITGVDREQALAVVKKSFPDEETSFGEKLMNDLTPEGGFTPGGIAKGLGMSLVRGFVNTLDTVGSVGLSANAFALGAGADLNPAWQRMIESGDYNGLIDTMMAGQKKSAGPWTKIKGAAARAGLSVVQLFEMMSTAGVAAGGEELWRSLVSHGSREKVEGYAMTMAKTVSDDPAVQKAVSIALQFADPTLLSIGGAVIARKLADAAKILPATQIRPIDTVLDVLALKTAAYPQQHLKGLTYTYLDSQPAADIEAILTRSMARIDAALEEPVDTRLMPEPPHPGEFKERPLDTPVTETPERLGMGERPEPPPEGTLKSSKPPGDGRPEPPPAGSREWVRKASPEALRERAAGIRSGKIKPRTQAASMPPKAATVAKVWPDDPPPRGEPLGPEPPAPEGAVVRPPVTAAAFGRSDRYLHGRHNGPIDYPGLIHSFEARQAEEEAFLKYGPEPPPASERAEWEREWLRYNPSAPPDQAKTEWEIWERKWRYHDPEPPVSKGASTEADIEKIHQEIMDDLDSQASLIAAQNGGKIPEAEAKELLEARVRADVTTGIIRNEASAAISTDIAETILRDPLAPEQSRVYAQKLITAVQKFREEAATWLDADAINRWKGSSERKTVRSNPRGTPVALPDFIDIGQDGELLFRNTPQSMANRLHLQGGRGEAQSRVPELNVFTGGARTSEEVKSLVNRIYHGILGGPAGSQYASWSQVVKGGDPLVSFKGVSDKDFDGLAEVFGVASPVKGMDDAQVVALMQTPEGRKQMEIFRKQVYDKLPPAVKKIYGTEEYGLFLHKTASVHKFLKEELLRVKGTPAENAVKQLAIEFRAVATGNSQQLENLGLLIREINERRGVRGAFRSAGEEELYGGFVKNEPKPAEAPTVEGTTRVDQAKKKRQIADSNPDPDLRVRSEREIEDEARGHITADVEQGEGLYKGDAATARGSHWSTWKDQASNDELSRFENTLTDALAGSDTAKTSILEDIVPERYLEAAEERLLAMRSEAGVDVEKYRSTRQELDQLKDALNEQRAAANSFSDVGDDLARADMKTIRLLEDTVGQRVFRPGATAVIENGEINLFNLRNGEHLQDIVNTAPSATATLHAKATGVTERIAASIKTNGSSPHNSLLLYKSMGVQQALREALENGGKISAGTRAFLGRFDIVAAADANIHHTWVKAGLDQLAGDLFDTLLTSSALKQGKFDLDIANTFSSLRSAPDKDRMVETVVKAFSSMEHTMTRQKLSGIRSKIVKAIKACQTPGA